MIKLKRFLPVLILLMIAACALPATRIYSIFLPLENITSDKLGLASITVSVDAEGHLMQPYIVDRKSPYKFSIAKYSKWESSPRKIVREGFKKALFLTGTFRIVKAASINPRGFYLLKVNLRRFERYREGGNFYALIEMDLKLWSPESEELYFKTVSRKEGIAGDDHSRLAEKLSASFEEVIEEVRADIIRIVETRNIPEAK